VSLHLPGEPGRHQSGGATVEFAVILPLLVMLSLGTADLGRAYWLETRLSGAARGGATFAQYYPSQVSAGAGCPDPQNVVYAAQHDEGASNGFTVSVFNASSGGTPMGGCNTATVGPGTYVTVVTSARFEMVTPFLSLLVPTGRTLSARSEVVVQG